jgi:hypothetical protein
MLSPENEQKLQQLFGRLNHEDLEAVYALATHLDEELHIQEERYEADLEMEANREYTQPLKVGFYHGKDAGSKRAGSFAVLSLSRLLTSPLQNSRRYITY